MAHALIDYSQEHDLMWVVFQDDSGECWTWRNSDIRGQDNASLGRDKSTLPANKEFWNMLLSS